MLRTGGLEDGRVVRLIDVAFLAKPTHKALLVEAMSGDERLTSDRFFTLVP